MTTKAPPPRSSPAYEVDKTLNYGPAYIFLSCELREIIETKRRVHRDQIYALIFEAEHRLITQMAPEQEPRLEIVKGNRK